MLIKAALLNIDKQNKLQDAVQKKGIAGGIEVLRNIMNTEGELHVMDRDMLAIIY